MAFEPELSLVSGAETAMNQDARIRLVRQRIAIGFYDRRDVLREVAARILAREEM
jgi:hypothetical protein